MTRMKLRGISRPRIFVRTEHDHPTPATRPPEAMLVGTGTRLVPTVYEGLRARRRRRLVFMFLTIGLPTALAAVYYGFFASNRFVSETQMVLSEQSGGGGGGLSSLAGAAGGGGGGKSSLLSMIGIAGGDSAGGNEQSIVTNYLQSVEAMDDLDKKIGLRRMWSAPSVDWWSRLSPDASQEDFFKYYGKHVTVLADPADPVIDVQAAAFRPGDAQLIAKTLVQLAQHKLNTAFLQMREDALAFARSEVKQAQQHLAQVDDKLRAFRNQHGELDPTASAQAVGGVAGALFSELASTEADLRTALSYARDDSPMAKSLQARIAALKKQIVASRGMLAGKDAGKSSGDLADKPYADLLAAYEGLVLDQTFAQDSYTSAMAFLNTSRASLQRQHSYLVDFLPPTLPQDAIEPRGLRNVVLAFLASLLLWLTGSLVFGALREHARR
jgi:capsular polysaccharide transport system permease protein